MRRLVLIAALFALVVPAWAEPVMTFTPETVSIEDSGRTVLRYRYRGVPFKPYVDVLTTPSGVNILRDAPHDHLHHHALMFAIKIDGVNYWEEGQAPGVQMHQGFHNIQFPEESARATFACMVHWQESGEANPLAMREDRRISSHGLVNGAAVATWQTGFMVTKSATLTGSHYHGLGMRFVESMDKVGEFRFAGGAGGEVVRGTEKLTPGNWAAYTAPAGDGTVTVAMFDHPVNPRPVLWFTMLDPFSYLSATINLHREPLVIERSSASSASHDVWFRYGIAVWDGRPEDAEIQAVYEEWLK